MRRLALALLALPILWFGGRWLLWALASDETRIRWHIEAMEAGYNDGDVGEATRPLHPDWRHDGHEIDRDTLRGVLFRELFANRDPETKALRRRVVVEPGSVAIRVDGERATADAAATFASLEAGAWRTTWRAAITADLVRTADGWKIMRTRHEDVEGGPLGR